MVTFLCIGLELLRIAIEKAGYTGRIQIGMDVAASEFCKDKKYDLDFKNPQSDPAHWVRLKLHSSSFSVQAHLSNGCILNHVFRASFYPVDNFGTVAGENPTPYGILALWAVNGLSIVYWAVEHVTKL